MQQKRSVENQQVTGPSEAISLIRVVATAFPSRNKPLRGHQIASLMRLTKSPLKLPIIRVPRRN
jgi:hypothetical protein